MTALIPGRADAAIHYSGIQDLTVSSSTANKYHLIDLDGDGSYDAGFVFVPLTRLYVDTISVNQSQVPFSGNLLLGYFNGGVLASSTTYAAQSGTTSPIAVIRNLPYGYSIGSGGPWKYGGAIAGAHVRYASTTYRTVNGLQAASTTTYNIGKFNGITGYMGVKFHSTACGSQEWNYAWIHFTATADATQGTIIDWAYEDRCNTAILAGAGAMQQTTTVPTLNQWGLLALVALLAGSGAVAMRRREEI